MASVLGRNQEHRPCVVISLDELNAHLRTFVIALLKTAGHSYPFRVRCHFENKYGYVVVDLLRAVDRDRLMKRLGVLAGDTLVQVLNVLQAVIAE